MEDLGSLNINIRDLGGPQPTGGGRSLAAGTQDNDLQIARAYEEAAQSASRFVDDLNRSVAAFSLAQSGVHGPADGTQLQIAKAYEDAAHAATRLVDELNKAVMVLVSTHSQALGGATKVVGGPPQASDSPLQAISSRLTKSSGEITKATSKLVEGLHKTLSTGAVAKTKGAWGDFASFLRTPSTNSAAALLNPDGAFGKGLMRLAKVGGFLAIAFLAIGVAVKVVQLAIKAFFWTLNKINERISEVGMFSGAIMYEKAMADIRQVYANIAEAQKNGAAYSAVLRSQTTLSVEWQRLMATLLHDLAPVVSAILTIAGGALKILNDKGIVSGAMLGVSISAGAIHPTLGILLNLARAGVAYLYGIESNTRKPGQNVNDWYTADIAVMTRRN